LEQYRNTKRKVKFTKYVLITTLLLVHLPGILIAYGLSVIDRERYFNIVLGCLILTRLTYVSLFGFVYLVFARLFLYFIDKKRSIQRTPLTAFQTCVVAWTFFLLFQKSSNILIIVTWSTYYQLLAPRTPTENLI
jgi:hypothetical protein